MNLIPFNASAAYIAKYEGELILQSQISLLGVILHFLIYISIHILLGVKKEALEKQTYRTPEEEQTYNFLKKAFKWWPMFYLLIIILSYI